jgi:hypothetical protein
MADARFEDGDEAPLYIGAEEPGDLAVMSALVQDAVFPIGEMTYRRGKRQFALLLNRFRWEDREAAAKARRGFERVQTVLAVAHVLAVQTHGIDRGDSDTVLSLLSLTWLPGTDGAGRLTLVLAGDGAIALEVEALEVTLKDVTRPYIAPSGKVPGHG